MTLNSALSPQGPIAVRPYRSDGGFSVNNVFMLVTGMILAGAVLGVVAHVVEQFFWLVLIFPLGIGLLLGLAGVRMIKLWHVRSPMIGALAGLLGGVSAMFCMHYSGFLQYKWNLEKLPNASRIEALSPSEQEALISRSDHPDELRAAIASMSSFKGYMDYLASKGVEISSHGDKPMNLGFVGSYIYWACEVLIVAGLSLVMVKTECGRPYCAACGAWKKETTLGGLSSPPPQAGAALAAGDLAALKACGPSPKLTNLMLYAAACPVCKGTQSPTELRLTQFVPVKKGQTKQKVIQFVTVSSDAIPAVCELFLPPTPPSLPITGAAPVDLNS